MEIGERDQENALEKISRVCDSKSIPRTLGNRIKDFAVDTSAAVIWSNVVFGPNEYYFGGLRGEEFAAQRIGMSLFNVALGGVFGRFRNFWTEKVMHATPESSLIYKAVSDVGASIVFYGPTYVAMMKYLGASWKETTTALGAGLVTCAITGRPYGWCLDKWRKLFGVKPALDR